jgi:hypothetical protein
MQKAQAAPVKDRSQLKSLAVEQMAVQASVFMSLDLTTSVSQPLIIYQR